MSHSEKKSPSRQGPDLIKEIKRRLGFTQKTLAPQLGITQQAVSDYERGKVDRERYDVLIKLQELLASAPDVNELEEELKDYVREGIDKESRKPKPTPTPKRKKKTTSSVPARRNAGN